jgi:hypothetical protein
MDFTHPGKSMSLQPGSHSLMQRLETQGFASPAFAGFAQHVYTNIDFFK